MAPLGTRLTTSTGELTEALIEFYARRALGGAAAITIEAMGVDYPLSSGRPNHVRFDDDAFIPLHCRLTERIHECGAKVFALLWHTGINRGMLAGKTPVGPSALLNPFTGIVPHELTCEEIEALIVKFGEAAHRAMLAGYDGCNVHGAHGYLLSSFVSLATNKRTDRYGGSFENRVRFSLEVVAAMRKYTRPDFPLLFRMNGCDFCDDGISIEEACEFAALLEKGGVSAIDVSAGVYSSIDTMIEPIQYKEGWKLYLAEKIKQHVSIPVLGVGVLQSPEAVEEALAKGMIDFACLGRELLAEPDWVNKAAGGDTHIRKCIGCNACFERIGCNQVLRCAINPLAGRDSFIPPAISSPLRIAIAGAGPAGITAAVTAADRGHKVTLFERSEHIGGQLTLAAAPPGKERMFNYIDFLRQELSRSSVELRLGAELDFQTAKGFDRVIIATGGSCRNYYPSGADESGVINAWKALKTAASDFSSSDIVIIGAGNVGCETALYLAAGGARVSLVEMRGRIAMDTDMISRIALMRELEQAGIKLYPSTTVSEIRNKNALLKDETSGIISEISCDIVVSAVGAKPEHGLADRLVECGYPVITVGDAVTIGKIGDAVRDGFNAAMGI